MGNRLLSHLVVIKTEEQIKELDRGDFTTWPFPSPLLDPNISPSHPQCSILRKTWHDHWPQTCNNIRQNQSCYRSITSQPLVTVKPSKKGSLLRCQERHELRAWCGCVGIKPLPLLLVILICCQLSLCVH